jgi:hypothetical protein
VAQGGSFPQFPQPCGKPNSRWGGLWLSREICENSACLKGNSVCQRSQNFFSEMCSFKYAQIYIYIFFISSRWYSRKKLLVVLANAVTSEVHKPLYLRSHPSSHTSKPTLSALTLLSQHGKPSHSGSTPFQ